jgi:hypothetical protein
VFSPVGLPAQDIQTQAIEALKNLPIEGEYSVSTPQAPFYPAIEDQLNPIWEHHPEILTFHFGIPSLSLIEKAHSLGIKDPLPFRIRWQDRVKLQKDNKVF